MQAAYWEAAGEQDYAEGESECGAVATAASTKPTGSCGTRIAFRLVPGWDRRARPLLSYTDQPIL